MKTERRPVHYHRHLLRPFCARLTNLMRAIFPSNPAGPIRAIYAGSIGRKFAGPRPDSPTLGPAPRSLRLASAPADPGARLQHPRYSARLGR
jgi:hypothetical protein